MHEMTYSATNNIHVTASYAKSINGKEFYLTL
jgi:hypothetical protein